MFQVPFVARERELAVLDAVLKDTLNGRFNAALISGSAGSGKSALAEEFLRRAQAQNPGLRVAIGGCNAQSGAVTPYLPFMDIVAQLSGTADSRDAGQGPPTKGMLKTATAVALKSLVEIGPDLIGTFVPAGELIGKGILEVARQAGWLAKLEESGKPRPPVDKERLLDQYVAVLADLGRHYPLLLVVDDMQWIDASSLELFNRILRRISGTPLFVLGMLRPLEDPAPSDDGRQRPTEAAHAVALADAKGPAIPGDDRVVGRELQRRDAHVAAPITGAGRSVTCRKAVAIWRATSNSSARDNNFAEFISSR